MSTKAGWKPLQWDDGQPWTLCLAVRQKGEDGVWRARRRTPPRDDKLGVREADLIVGGGLVVHKRTQIARLDDFGAFDWVSLVTEEKCLAAENGEEQELVDQLARHAGAAANSTCRRSCGWKRSA